MFLCFSVLFQNADLTVVGEKFCRSRSGTISARGKFAVNATLRLLLGRATLLETVIHEVQGVCKSIFFRFAELRHLPGQMEPPAVARFATQDRYIAEL